MKEVRTDNLNVCSIFVRQASSNRREMLESMQPCKFVRHAGDVLLFASERSRPVR
jgi:hypothetical protein